MDLQDQLDARRTTLDGAYREAMNSAIAHLRSAGVAGGGKVAGDRAPDFALPDRNGRPTSLSSLLARGPVVLSFFRGEWCSFCRIELDALIEARAAIAALGGRLLMVSPQNSNDALLERTRDAPDLTVLRDGLNGVGLRYGLVFRMPDPLRHALLALGIDLSLHYGSDAWLLPIPATYVVRPDGIIALAHVEPDYTRRLEPSAIIDELAAPAQLRRGTVTDR